MIRKGMLPKEKAEELKQWAMTFGASEEVATLFAIKMAHEIISCFREDQMTPSKWWWEEVKKELQGEDIEEIKLF